MATFWSESMGRQPGGQSAGRWMPMEDLEVDRGHPFSGVVIAALREGRVQREGTPQMMARAVKAVLDIERTMSVGGAYNLVNRLWVR